MRIHLYLLFFILFSTRSVCSHAQIITTIAGNGAAGYSGNGGAATTAMLDSPTSVAVNALGNLYIDDQRNSCVRKIDQAGAISTFAGTGAIGYSGNGGPASSARLGLNWGIAIDRDGNLYITDQFNYRIRKVTAGGIITTIAGTGAPGYSGDNGPATLAAIDLPCGITVDNAGNIYFGDPNNICVRKIDPSGIITTFAGNRHPGYSGDGGPATNARLSNNIWGLAADNMGNVYICDAYNHCVRRVDASGIITTFAGNGSRGYSGDNGPANAAQLNTPEGLCVSPAGDVYICDYADNRIRKVDASGIITTIAGNGHQGYSGDGNLAIYAQLNHPTGIALDGTDNLYVADLGNVRIRKISNGKILYFTQGRHQSAQVCENASSLSLNSFLCVDDQLTGALDQWGIVSGPAHGSAAVTYDAVSPGGANTPTGLTYNPTNGFSGSDTLEVYVHNAIAADTTSIYISVVPLVTSAGNITGDSAVCVGSSIGLSDSVAGGTWSASGTAGVIGINQRNGKAIGISAGIAQIFYTVSNNCNSVSAVKTITVNPLPAISAISGPSAICIGFDAVVSDQVNGGTWTCKNHSASFSAAPPIGSESAIDVRGLSTGVDTFIYQTANFWCTAAASYVLSVDTLPDPGVIAGAAELCTGSQATLSDVSALPGSWSGGSLATVNGGVVTALSPGADTVTYSVSNACGSAQALHLILIYDSPDEPLISERAGVLYAPPGYFSYQWTNNGNPIPGATSDSLPMISSGVYQVIVSSSYGCTNHSADISHSDCNPTDLIIYPNPSSSKIYVNWCKKLTINVMSYDGRSVITVRNSNEIDLGELPNGVYILSIFDEFGNKVQVKKITKIE